MARSFNGTSDVVENTTTAPVTVTPFTVAAWFNPSASAATMNIVGIGDGSSNANRFILQLLASGGSPGTVRAVVDSSASIAVTTSNWTTNAWQHACGIWGGLNDRRVYLNGGSKGTDTGVGSTPTGINHIAAGVGYSGAGYNSFFAGKIAEIGVWNVALTDGEVAALAAGERCYKIRPLALKLYWPLDGLASPEPDFSGNKTNGTLTGTAFASGPPITAFTPKGAAAQEIVLTPETFLKSGTFVAPTTVVQVECWGGGAGGVSGGVSLGGNGGGGGGYSKAIVSGLTVGNSYSVTVGAAVATDTNGNDSYFIDTSTALAKGGAAAGTGGAAASGVGIVRFSGGNGGTDGTSGAGGGGSSAGPAANGGAGSNGSLTTGGAGGTAPTGGGAGGAGGNTTVIGTVGTAPGGAGGGGGATAAGGGGAAGKVVVSWPVNPYNASLLLNQAVKRASLW